MAIMYIKPLIHEPPPPSPPLKQKEMKERAKSEKLCQEGLSTAVGRIYNRIPLTVLLHHIYGTLSLSAKRDEAVCYSCIKNI